ncbi:hypothetical protein, partial [Ferrovum myxofaciens]|uniref:hypothetical protein n=1 Tax=Ferrovum myxofaciens TaxID=416213 RepID=UPI001F3DED65
LPAVANSPATLGFHTCSPVSQSEEEYAEKLSRKIQRRWLTAYPKPAEFVHCADRLPTLKHLHSLE